jgi:hypothetical protein
MADGKGLMPAFSPPRPSRVCLFCLPLRYAHARMLPKANKQIWVAFLVPATYRDTAGLWLLIYATPPYGNPFCCSCKQLCTRWQFFSYAQNYSSLFLSLPNTDIPHAPADYFILHVVLTLSRKECNCGLYVSKSDSRLTKFLANTITFTALKIIYYKNTFRN